MNEIKRTKLDEKWAHSAVVEANGFVFVSYCMGNIDGSIEEQINGAFDTLSGRLKTVGLTPENVVQMDCLFKNIADLNYLSDIIKERFGGTYPARKAFETKFIFEEILFQVDAVAFKG